MEKMRVTVYEEPSDKNCKCGRRHFKVNEHPYGEYVLIRVEDVQSLYDYSRDFVEEFRKAIEGDVLP